MDFEEKMIDVSIIIVSFNTRELLESLLISIIENTKRVRFEIIVVDNASTDDSARLAKELTKEVLGRVLKNTKNLGFAKANNQGIRRARGKYLLLLNSDTHLIEDSVSGMFDFLEKDKSVGVAGCKLLNRDGSLQENGGFFPDIWRLFLWALLLDDLPVLNRLNLYHPHKIFYQGKKSVDWVTGAFFMIRRNVIEEVGLFSEKFFMYVEEIEYCWRVKKFGWRVIYNPLTSIVHIGGASSNREKVITGEYRGLIVFYKLHKSRIENMLLRIFLKTGAFLRVILFGLILRKKGFLVSYAKAFFVN